MRRLRWVLLLILTAVPSIGCSSGGECDTCSMDSDCNSGFVCTSFSDGSSRCGSGVGTTSCRVR